MATNKQLAELMGALDTAGKTNAEIVISAYEQLFNRTPDTDGMNYWVGRLDAGLSTTDLQAALLDGIRFYEGTFAAEAIADLAITSSKRTVADALLAAGVTGAEAATFLAGVTDAATRDAALADIEAANPTDPTDPTDPVDPTESVTISLDTKSNNVAGEAADDTFYAFVQQNEAGTGTVANALSTGDFIDGKGGWDVVDATMINDQKTPTDEDFFPMPVITNVEEIRIQALDSATVGSFDDGVTLDADRITGEEHYASDRSRGDLTIINVNLDADQITKNIVIEMKNTQQNSDMAVYFNEQDLIAAPAVTTQSAEFFIQVADGNAQDDTKPLDNIKFDLSFTQGTETHTFEGLSAVNGTYTGLVAVIEAALAEQGLTGYTVALGSEFNSFTTGSQTFSLNYTGNFVTVTDDSGVAFDEINFTPSQKSGTTLAIILAQSDVDADSVTVTNKVEATIILDGVGRGSNGGELVVGSTSASASSTGIEVFNIVVEKDSVIHDISTTNDDNASWAGFQEINLTNGTVKGDFVLTNNAAYNQGDADGMYDNVDNAVFKEGLNKITATNFEGDIVLGRDSDIVDLGTLSANVAGNVTYNATLNDNDNYVVVTGAGTDTINITLDDNRDDADTDVDTAVTISTGAANDTITVDEDNTSSENTTATIDAGAGNDVIRGNDVSVTVTAGTGNDVVYAENTGVKALLNTGSSTYYTTAVPATQTVGETDGTIHFLAGRTVTVTIATNGNAAGILTNGYETSAAVKITAASGALTTQADLNAAIVKAVNEDAVLSKIATAYVDENNNVQVKYLVDGVQDAGAVEVTITDPAAATSVTTAMLNEYRDLVNNSTLTSAYVLGLYNAALTSTNASTASAEGSTILFTTAGTAGDTVTFYIGDDAVSYTATGTTNGDAAALVDALVAKGYTADDTVADTVAVVTDKEITFEDAGAAPTTAITLTNDAALTIANIATMVGTNSVDNDNTNTVNGGAGDDVIVLSSDATLADTVVWTGYSQGNDTIVHFITGTDKLDFTSYLTGTVDANNNGSTSDESEIALAVTTAANDTFTANSINLIDFAADLDAITTQTFATLTAAQVEALLEADASANTVLTAAPGDLYQTNGVSVLVIHDDTAVVGNDGSYKAYEVTYADATTAAGATDFTVKLIGSFDLGDTAAPSTLVVGDFAL